MQRDVYKRQATGSVACSSYTGYTLELSYVKVFGVCWNYSAQSTALTRLKKATDPNGLVNVDITTNPAPAVGTGAGSSPFDNYLPWSGMDEYNICLLYTSLLAVAAPAVPVQVDQSQQPACEGGAGATQE